MAAPAGRGELPEVPTTVARPKRGAGGDPVAQLRGRCHARVRSPCAFAAQRRRRPGAPAPPGCGPRRSRRRSAAPRPCRRRAARSPGAALRGLVHTTRWASRCSRAICSPSSVASPRSHPSRQHDDDGAARGAALAPAVEELLEQLAEPGAAAGVGQRGGDRGHRGVGLAQRQLAGEPGQPGAEREHLGGGAAAGGGVGEAQQRVGVDVHAAADVDEQHDPARADGGAPVAQPGGLAAGAQDGAQRAAGVDRAARGRRRRRETRGSPGSDEPGQQPAQLGALVRGEPADVALAQLLEAAGGGDVGGRAALALVDHALAARLGDGLHLAQLHPLLPGDLPGPVAEPGLEDPVEARRRRRGRRTSPAGRPSRPGRTACGRAPRRPGPPPAPGRREASTPACRSVRPSPTRLSVTSYGAASRRAAAHEVNARSSIFPTSTFARSWSSRYLSTAPRVAVARSASSRSAPSASSACVQSIDSATPGRLEQVLLPQRPDGPGDVAGERLGRLGHAGPHDGDLALELRVLDPVVEAAALERVVHLAGAVARDDDDRRHLARGWCRARGRSRRSR